MPDEKKIPQYTEWYEEYRHHKGDYVAGVPRDDFHVIIASSSDQPLSLDSVSTIAPLFHNERQILIQVPIQFHHGFKTLSAAAVVKEGGPVRVYAVYIDPKRDKEIYLVPATREEVDSGTR